ncbi:hypothetical protein ASPZODRAFT_66584 [Penicilliopsis zonata CBS 506.65]|uniref:Ribosomal RNA-processing protein 8 n=1 Tax=Penicilliopsis zonata CBS 506.65 TaxID=1073090 RepID=A0A1L9SHS3_9EURO|nr:hypothetical protein ASPZODRAFT_66584 [Penicilliopsis zonata CBS 506.65]OJJ46770.1 hypothetical protein ASPZODRAFT_66584 [Penicilliopsis zonata CBS 506.65]
MFAVPGWSVSSSALKQQTEPQSQAQNEQKQDETPKPGAKSNKRKRGKENVTKGNVDEMFRRVIEGQESKTDKKRKKDPKPKEGSGLEKSQPVNTSEVGDAGKGNKRKNKRKDKAKDKPQTEEGKSSAVEEANSLSSAPPPTTTAILTPLQQAMRQKLISARFRHLNETLYTTPSSQALELFDKNPEFFQEYHSGFARQVKESWPSNPVDGYIKSIKTRGAIHSAPKRSGSQPDASSRPQLRPLPRRPNGLCTIADLGCGDAHLARSLTPSAKKMKLKLQSYDLQAPDPLITKADIANLPVEDGSVDVAIFCLSLMGTNWVSFVEEAWRVLRGDGKGECWVSEVKSRFGKITRKKAQIGAKKAPTKAELKKLKKAKRGGGNNDGDDSDVEDAEIYAEDARPQEGADETDISSFVEVFRTRGFILKPESVDKSNKMFVRMEFVKQGGAPSKGQHASLAAAGTGKKKFIDKVPVGGNMTPDEEAKVLKPCVYKIR